MGGGKDSILLGLSGSKWREMLLRLHFFFASSSFLSVHTTKLKKLETWSADWSGFDFAKPKSANEAILDTFDRLKVFFLVFVEQSSKLFLLVTQIASKLIRFCAIFATTLNPKLDGNANFSRVFRRNFCALTSMSWKSSALFDVTENLEVLCWVVLDEIVTWRDSPLKQHRENVQLPPTWYLQERRASFCIPSKHNVEWSWSLRR